MLSEGAAYRGVERITGPSERVGKHLGTSSSRELSPPSLEELGSSWDLVRSLKREPTVQKPWAHMKRAGA